ncbi:hypothetical protein CSW71_26335, partial [Shigella sonnei]
DGWTVVPKNLRIDFYTKDNDFTKGLSVLSEVNKRHTEAQKGLTPSLNISKDDLKSSSERAQYTSIKIRRRNDVTSHI